MTPLQEILRRAAKDLDALGFDFALIGGLAVSVRSQPRFTADVDLAVSVSSDHEAEALVRKLRDRGWEIATLIEQEETERLATVRLLGGEEGAPVVDLLFASSGLEPEIVAEAEPLEVFPEHTIPVASLGHLVALKLLARDERRPQDDADLQALIQVAEEEDLSMARRAVGLIQRRGFARGRDLEAALTDLTET